jgi:hypothetical protein
MRFQARTSDGIIDGTGETPLENIQLFQYQNRAVDDRVGVSGKLDDLLGSSFSQ